MYSAKIHIPRSNIPKAYSTLNSMVTIIHVPYHTSAYVAVDKLIILMS